MKLTYRQHAVKRMHERCISEEDYADDVEEDTRIIITVYEPDQKIWCEDLKT